MYIKVHTSIFSQTVPVIVEYDGDVEAELVLGLHLLRVKGDDDLRVEHGCLVVVLEVVDLLVVELEVAPTRETLDNTGVCSYIHILRKSKQKIDIFTCKKGFQLSNRRI